MSTGFFTDIEHFQEFLENPKGSDRHTILGSIKYIEDTIIGKEQGPKCGSLIHVFNQFSINEIKDYVYQRMTKPILLELALAILREIANGGPEWAKNLSLVLKRTSKNGKEMQIAPPPQKGEFAMAPEDESIYIIKIIKSVILNIMN